MTQTVPLRSEIAPKYKWNGATTFAVMESCVARLEKLLGQSPVVQ